MDTRVISQPKMEIKPKLPPKFRPKDASIVTPEEVRREVAHIVTEMKALIDTDLAKEPKPV